jgi:hypothetical protein
MTCPDCGESLDTTPVGQPCPRCGGFHRDAVVSAQTAEARVEAPLPTIAIGYSCPRPWRQKWQDVLDAVELVERDYQPQGSLGNEKVRRNVEGFFQACRELADWLWQNAGVTKSKVHERIRQSHYLRLADAMAQTAKHHTRTPASQNQNPITAAIAEIRVGADGARVRIDWSRPNGSRGSRDALELARGCIRSWRRFLHENSL